MMNRRVIISDFLTHIADSYQTELFDTTDGDHIKIDSVRRSELIDSYIRNYDD